MIYGKTEVQEYILYDLREKLVITENVLEAFPSKFVKCCNFTGNPQRLQNNDERLESMVVKVTKEEAKSFHTENERSRIVKTVISTVVRPLGKF